MEKSKTCTFTGHRESKLPWRSHEEDARCVALKDKIFDTIEALYHSGYTHFICGMANGCDMYFGEAVLKLRAEHEEVTLEAAIPYEGQAEKWRDDLKKRYERLATECDFQTVVQHAYSPECMMRRNQYMVDSSGVLIAAYNGSAGGTRNTLLYAMRSGLQVVQIPVEEI